MTHSQADINYMNLALALAKRAVGNVSPNPAVGCVIVKNNQIISVGITAPGGRPHAETIAIEKAGDNARGATAYVTLEPCCHIGKTSPCTDALIAAGIKRVVIATIDEFHKVNGGGIKQLKEAGIEVLLGVCEEESQRINAGFFSVHRNNRPYITVKIATSLDGKIATKTGDSKWITGDIARRYAHLLRAQNDAIIVGSGTVIGDNPELTCRLPGLEKESPIRVILQGKRKISPDCKLLKSSENVPVWQFEAEDSNGQVNLAKMLQMLAEKGMTRVLVEGGQKILQSFLEQKLIDELVWIRAPIIVGNDGIAAISGLGIEEITSTINPGKVVSRKLGNDTLEIYRI